MYMYTLYVNVSLFKIHWDKSQRKYIWRLWEEKYKRLKNHERKNLIEYKYLFKIKCFIYIVTLLVLLEFYFSYVFVIMDFVYYTFSLKPLSNFLANVSVGNPVRIYALRTVEQFRTFIWLQMSFSSICCVFVKFFREKNSPLRATYNGH